MKRFQKLTGLILALCLTGSLTAVSALAYEPPVYLALGDSISTGYGLDDPDSGFVGQIAAHYPGYTLVNHAVNGNTAAGVYEQLKDGELDDALSRADLITLTCGGNDMMAILYEKVAAAYNTDHPAAPITPSEVTAIMGGTHDTLDSDDLTDYTSAALRGLADSEAFYAGLEAYRSALRDVMTYIRSINSSASVVMTTQYNPYKSFQINLFYSFVYTEMEPGAQKLNEVITGCAEELGYTVADVHAVFTAAQENLCNATVSLLAPLLGKANFDFHPNAAGHAVMAQVILALEPGSPLAKGTVDPDSGEVTLSLPALEEAAIVTAAFYDQNGRMLDCAMTPVDASQQEAVLPVRHSDAAHVQLFLLSGGTYAPLCRSLTITSE